MADQNKKKVTSDKLKATALVVATIATSAEKVERVQGACGFYGADCGGCATGCTSCSSCQGTCSWGCQGSCKGCTSCSGKCSGCTGCTGCTSCSGSCSGCTGCSESCSGCTGCTSCSGCSSCSGCTSCTSCSGSCSGCTSCSSCSGCSGCRNGCSGSVYARYTITLDGQDATIAGTASVTVKVDDSMPTIIPPTRIGYTFDGYYLQPNGGDVKYYDADGHSVKTWDNINNVSGYGRTGSSGYVTSTATLYAKWIRNTYELNYETHGGKFKDGIISRKKSESVKSLKGRRKYVSTYNVESEDIVLENPERKGMEFEGWDVINE